jgi:saccharopine dehydrogenase (NADP+, L-glutamate forming)
MKKILVLGAGLVCKPLVRYLLDQPEYHVTVASRTVSKAIDLIDGHEKGVALPLNVEDNDALDKLVSEHDLTISLVPYAYHVAVAKLCIKHKKQMVTTSYVSEEMKALDGQAKEAGITILNEIGLDPGIDHMSAMKIIHKIQGAGGKVTRFFSFCGGLPAPEADTNPWGYKFSWSPRGVVLAGRNNARYLKEGANVDVPGPDLFGHHWAISAQGYGELEAYLNRDSIPYIDIYGLQGVKNMLRGTLRNAGWCYTMKKLADIDYFSLDEIDLSGMTAADVTCRMAGVEKGGDVKAKVAAAIDVNIHTNSIYRMEWLGLFGDTPVAADAKSPIDVLAALMNEKLVYADGECDLCVMQHEFEAEYPDGRREETISTLIDTGIPGGDSSMARTVSLPAAIGAKMILEGKITDRGVFIPVAPSIYEPVLEELASDVNVIFRETTRAL